MNELTTGRVQTLTSEILFYKRQAQQTMLNAAIEIGRRMEEAKALLPHGEWGKWLEEKCEFSQSTANNFMRVYREYGADQENLFSPKSQAFEKLSYTQALRLLSVPAEERAEFAEHNNVADMSTRQLEQAIKERDEAKIAERNAQEMCAAAQEQAEAARTAKSNAERSLMLKETTLAEANKKVDSLRKELADARKEADKARKEAAELKARDRKIPEEVLTEIRKTAAAEAAEKAEAEIAARVKKAEEEAKKAKEQKEAAEEQLRTAQQKEAEASPEAAVFMALFSTVQEDYNKLMGALIKVQNQNPELARKLKNAVAALLDKMRGKVA